MILRAFIVLNTIAFMIAVNHKEWYLVAINGFLAALGAFCLQEIQKAIDDYNNKGA